jgi:hypothetical protein
MSALGARITGTPFSMPLVWMILIAIVGWFVLLRRDVREGEPDKKPSVQDA